MHRFRASAIWNGKFQTKHPILRYFWYLNSAWKWCENQLMWILYFKEFVISNSLEFLNLGFYVSQRFCLKCIWGDKMTWICFKTKIVAWQTNRPFSLIFYYVLLSKYEIFVTVEKYFNMLQWNNEISSTFLMYLEIYVA